MRASHKVDAVFDDPSLVSAAELLRLLRLAESAGLQELLEERLAVPAENSSVKASGVIVGMLAVRTASTTSTCCAMAGCVGAFPGCGHRRRWAATLRSFTHGHVQQVDAVASRLLAGLAKPAPSLLAGGKAIAFLDIDDTIREAHGYAKHGRAYGYRGVCGRTRIRDEGDRDRLSSDHRFRSPFPYRAASPNCRSPGANARSYACGNNYSASSADGAPVSAGAAALGG